MAEKIGPHLQQAAQQTVAVDIGTQQMHGVLHGPPYGLTDQDQGLALIACQDHFIDVGQLKDGVELTG